MLTDQTSQEGVNGEVIVINNEDMDNMNNQF